MERARQLIVPVLAVGLIASAAVVSRRMSERRVGTCAGGGINGNHSRSETRYEPIVYRFLYAHEPGAAAGRLTFARVVEGRIRKNATWSFGSLDDWYEWAPAFFAAEEGWTSRTQPGWLISRWLCEDKSGRCTTGQLFWRIQALRYFDPESFVHEIEWIEVSGKTLQILPTEAWPRYDYDSDTLYWNPSMARYVPEDESLERKWFATTPLITLASTLSHAYYDLCRNGDTVSLEGRETFAVADENRMRHILFLKDPACSQIRPRPGCRETWPDAPGDSPEQAWWDYHGRVKY